MRSKIFLLLIFLLPVIFSFSQSNHVFKNVEKWLPENFNPANSTLLIQQFEPEEPKAEKRNEKISSYMQEKYTYQYALAQTDDIVYKGGKYADKVKYPYALMYRHLYKSAGQGGSYSSYDFYFLERTTGIEYPLTSKSSSDPIMTFKPVINTIMEKFTTK
ncbi:MAG: hypothetical protein ABIN74_03600 [Ferruginibacter sp.]